MELEAIGRGVLSKTFFGPGTSVRVGDLLAIISREGEDGPRTDETCRLRVKEHIRIKLGAQDDA